ncbi:MAG: nucleotidyltransferase domain-containing protein [Chloroflexi bacterium]|nr:nucleotidyltransferase domain-containing protein [Chloroflexota bacterium]
MVKKLVRKLGGQLEAVFLYGSLAQSLYQPDESDINLLAVVADGTSIHALRKLFLPIWREYGDVLCRAPLIAQESIFVRYLTVAPTFAHHLIHKGQILFGPPDYLDGWPATDPYDSSAHLAWEAINASAALTPDLLDPSVAGERLLQLRRLARRLHGKPLGQEKTAVELFALVQHYLGREILALTGPLGIQEPTHTTATMLPGLQAIYKQSDQMVMVFQKLTPHQIMAVQWSALAKRVANRCQGLQVTTIMHLKLIAELERPLDLVFKRYEHDWGLDPLGQVNLSKQQILRQAARLPTDIQINQLPNAYLTQDNDKLYDIIHDFQNKLLNVQLEHELLCRLQSIERFVPPEPLPDRTAPASVRIDAIFKQLGWWSEYYANEMMNAE